MWLAILLCGCQNIPEGASVLDVGTGCGIQAIVASQRAERVLGVDVNPDAVLLAGENAGLNGVLNVEFLVSDLFENVCGIFDVVLFNTPYLLEDACGVESTAWAGGAEREVVSRFLDDAKNHLEEDGFMVLVTSDACGSECLEKMFSGGGYEFELAGSEKVFFEDLLCYRLWVRKSKKKVEPP